MKPFLIARGEWPYTLCGTQGLALLPAERQTHRRIMQVPKYPILLLSPCTLHEWS